VNRHRDDSASPNSSLIGSRFACELAPSRVLALTVALLAGVSLALGVGAPAAAAAAAPPPEAITTPVDQAPAGPGVTTFALGGMQRVVVLSCQPAPDRQAWAVPSTPGVVKWFQPPVSYISGTVPVFNTDALGWPVELVAFGSDAPGSVPVFRSGCVENHSGAAGGGQSQLTWGDPAGISSTTATGLRIIDPAASPGPGAALAILPGASGTDSAARPVTAAAPTATEAPRRKDLPGASGTPSSAAEAAPTYTDTPADSAPPTPADSGGGIPWGAIIFGILTVLFAASSRLTSRRVRRDDDVAKIPLRGHLGGIAAAVTGLIASAYAPTSVGGFFGAAVLAVIVGLVLSAQRAAHAGGHLVSLRALAQVARSEPASVGVGAVIGAIVGYIPGSSLATPAALYGILAGAAIGLGGAHLRQRSSAVAGWRVDAAVVADILGIGEKAITETGEVTFSTTPEGGFVVSTLNQAARGHLEGIEDRCAAAAPQLMITRADRMRVEAGPVDAETAAHREAMAGSGGLVGGAHAGADPWTPAAPANSGVNMSKPVAGAAPDALDLSRGWD